MRLSPSKVSREVRTYVRQVAGKGVPFSEYLQNVLRLHKEARDRLDEAYDRTTYRDPTADRAIASVMRERGAA